MKDDKFDPMTGVAKDTVRATVDTFGRMVLGTVILFVVLLGIIVWMMLR